ncbi:MAG: macro domain-containing protein [Bacteroidales bacterium]|nr:macro domain-containing protein [Bacteroidales bacterium]
MIFHLINADITLSSSEAIVNAANYRLIKGGGVDAAIHRAAGDNLQQACIQLGGCKTGEACITPGFNLKASYVIHTVGPVWTGGKNNEYELLALCYENSLKLASNYNIRSIAFPNISTGIYGFPKPDAAIIAIESCSKMMLLPEMPIEVSFYCFDAENYNLYAEILKIRGLL